MQRINTSDGRFKNYNKINLTAGTVITAEWLNAVQEEITNAIEAFGVSLNANNNDQLKNIITNILSDKIDISNIDTLFPSMTGQTGKFLFTDGVNRAWADPVTNLFALLSSKGILYIDGDKKAKTSASLTWDYDNNRLGIGTQTPNNYLHIPGLINFNPSTLSTFLGITAGNVSTGLNNIGIGSEALRLATSAASNIAVGNASLYSLLSGINNTAIGYNAGYLNTGSNNVFIGYQAGYNETGSQKLYIANTSTNTPLIYGDFSTGRLGFGTITPTEKLEIIGYLKVSNGVKIGSTFTSTLLSTASLDRVLTLPDISDEITTNIAAQTLVNKTLTSPIISNFINANHNHSSAATGGTISHTALTDKGSNTHSQIDSHLSSTANPHSTTASQVGADPAGTASSTIGTHESTYSHNLLHSNSNDPTSDQKSALAGTSGVPSSTNKYVTNDDSRLTDSRTPSAHTHIATEVTEDTTHRFTTDTEKSTWNNKLLNMVEDTTPQLGGDLDLNQKSISLATALSIDHTTVGIIDSVTVDANSTGFGAALYMASDGNYEEADADASTTMPVTALAIDTGTGASKKVLLWGYIRDDSWSWTPGGLVYASLTTGGLTQTAPTDTGNQVQAVGLAKTTNILFFNPSLVLVEV